MTQPPEAKAEEGSSNEPVLAGIKPEDWVCFGTIDPTHPDCQKCPFKTQCEAKSKK